MPRCRQQPSPPCLYHTNPAAPTRAHLGLGDVALALAQRLLRLLALGVAGKHGEEVGGLVLLDVHHVDVRLIDRLAG